MILLAFENEVRISKRLYSLESNELTIRPVLAVSGVQVLSLLFLVFFMDSTQNSCGLDFTTKHVELSYRYAQKKTHDDETLRGHP